MIITVVIEHDGEIKIWMDDEGMHTSFEAGATEMYSVAFKDATVHIYNMRPNQRLYNAHVFARAIYTLRNSLKYESYKELMRGDDIPY